MSEKVRISICTIKVKSLDRPRGAGSRDRTCGHREVGAECGNGMKAAQAMRVERITIASIDRHFRQFIWH
jgi:hypothetical protein